MLSDGAKKVIIISMVVSGIIGIAGLVDIISGIPFKGFMVLDIVFLVGAALVGYLGWDTLREAK